MHPKKIVIIGGGIIGSTMAYILHKILPSYKINIYERLSENGRESSDTMHNAGTGHAAFCEMNYSPELSDGSIDLKKSIQIAKQFEYSREFWAHLVKEGCMERPETFITSVPHLSFVSDEKNKKFLKKRSEAMLSHPLFEGLQYSDNVDEISKWVPVVMKGRKDNSNVAATKMDIGTDVNYGALSRQILKYLDVSSDVEVFNNHEIIDAERLDNGDVKFMVKNTVTKETHWDEAEFLFVAAGGGSLKILQAAKIKEAKGYGGFPIGGQFLVCQNEDLINNYHAKVYAAAMEGMPPIAAPHMDTRIIDGKKSILFGAFALFSTKFLKQGSNSDLFNSLRIDNIRTFVSSGLKNVNLTKYLISQLRLSFEEKVESLRYFYPEVEAKDWKLHTAGQRVQIIKRDEVKGSIVQLGTEILTSNDKKVSAILGASPGASISAAIIIEVLEKCFAQELNLPDVLSRLKSIFPSYLQNLDDKKQVQRSRNFTSEILDLVG